MGRRVTSPLIEKATTAMLNVQRFRLPIAAVALFLVASGLVLLHALVTRSPATSSAADLALPPATVWPSRDAQLVPPDTALTVRFADPPATGGPRPAPPAVGLRLSTGRTATWFLPPSGWWGWGGPLPAFPFHPALPVLVGPALTVDRAARTVLVRPGDLAPGTTYTVTVARTGRVPALLRQDAGTPAALGTVPDDGTVRWSFTTARAAVLQSSDSGALAGSAHAMIPGADLTATATGPSAAFVLTAYRGNPAAVAPPQATARSRYFALTELPGNAIQQLTIQSCAPDAGTSILWWTGSGWRRASRQQRDLATGCATVTIDAASAPALAGPAILTFATVPAPAVSGLSPVEGPATGGTVVTIHGMALGNATAVSFGAQAARSFRVLADDTLTAVAPPALADGAADLAVAVTVATPEGTTPATAGGRFYYDVVWPPAVVASLSPDHGAPGGGTPVTLQGSGLRWTRQVYFGEAPATSFAVQSDRVVTAVAPAGTGSVEVRVLALAGKSTAGSAPRFHYTPPGSSAALPSATATPGPAGAAVGAALPATAGGMAMSGSVDHTVADGGDASLRGAQALDPTGVAFTPARAAGADVPIPAPSAAPTAVVVRRETTTEATPTPTPRRLGGLMATPTRVAMPSPAATVTLPPTATAAPPLPGPSGGAATGNPAAARSAPATPTAGDAVIQATPAPVPPAAGATTGSSSSLPVPTSSTALSIATRTTTAPAATASPAASATPAAAGTPALPTVGAPAPTTPVAVPTSVAIGTGDRTSTTTPGKDEQQEARTKRGDAAAGVVRAVETAIAVAPR